MSRLTIFEGPDGGGKSVAAEAWCKATGAARHHHPAYTGLSEIESIYHLSMLPAALGLCDVVLDRCWLSEVPYGRAYRDGADRVGDAGRRRLEATARSLDTVVVLCLPPWEACRSAFARRAAVGQEYLRSEEQLRRVYREYEELRTDLPAVFHDWTVDRDMIELHEKLRGAR